MSSGPTDKAEAREARSDAGEKSEAPRSLEPSRGGVVESPKAMTDAQRAKKYRNGKRSPEWLKQEAERQRRYRERKKREGV